jgi:hypothetical protein
MMVMTFGGDRGRFFTMHYWADAVFRHIELSWAAGISAFISEVRYLCGSVAMGR